MQWPVKKKDPSAPNITRWIEKFAFLPVKTKTHWVWLEKYWQLQFSRHSLCFFDKDPVYVYTDYVGSGFRRAKFKGGKE